MGVHLLAGKFQSDKYPACPAGKVPLSTRDPMAQDLLDEYAIRHRTKDAEFSDDLQEALRLDGFVAPIHRPSSIDVNFTACGLPLQRFPIDRNLALGDLETCTRCTHVVAQVRAADNADGTPDW